MQNRLKQLSRLLIITLISTLLFACAGRKPNITIPKKEPPALQPQGPIRVALVLGGGGARGFAHVGAIAALQDAHIPVDLIAGSSAGSIVAALYADNGDAKQVYNDMMQADFWCFADIENYPSRKGIIQGYHLQKFLLKHMWSKTFSETKIPLFVTGTNVQTGVTHVFHSGPIAPAVNASAAVPGVFWPVKLYGHTYMDGGVLDAIPVNAVLPYHPKVIVAVDIAKTVPDKVAKNARGLHKRAMLMIWNKYGLYSARGANVIVHPNVGQTGLFDIAAKHRLYKVGYAAMKQKIPEIKKLLNS